MKDPISEKPVREIDPRIYDLYESKFGADLDDISDKIEALADSIHRQFDRAEDANNMAFIAACHFIGVAAIMAQERGMPISLAWTCVNMANVITREGFEVNGEWVMPQDDYKAVALPLEPPAPGEPILHEAIMANLPEWFANHLRATGNNRSGK